MNKSTSLFVSGLLVGALLSTTGFAWLRRHERNNVGSTSDQFVLKLAHTQDAGHPVHKSIEKMKAALEELSGNSMTIDIYPGSVLGSETQCIEQLQNGSLSMTKTSAAAIENFVPEMAVFGLPYVFRSDRHFWNVIEGEIGDRLLQKGNQKFVRGLCYYDAGSRNFYTKDRPIRTPDDLVGLKIRVMNSATAMEMVESLGAAPTPIAWGELYSSLEQGIADGAENNLPSFTTNKHYEVCKHFSLNGHTRVPDVLLIGTKTWDRLSAQQQDWLNAAAEQSARYQKELWAAETQRAKERAEAEGVTIHQVDTSRFADAVQPMLDRIENPAVKNILQSIREVE